METDWFSTAGAGRGRIWSRDEDGKGGGLGVERASGVQGRTDDNLGRGPDES